MFENTLLIMKADFMANRKCLLLHLLSKGFQIQGTRKLAFTPEDAGEFYRDLADDKCYMLYVIMLSKGTSEAFILTKTNAAEELLHTMICYFGTSMEMERNVHVSRNAKEARREITFIFPNYIHEPIPVFDKHKFSKEPVLAPLLSEAYDIIKQPSENQHENWRVQLSDWLFKKNAIYPEISNQCSRSPNIAQQEKQQQTELMMVKDLADVASISSASTMPGATSDLMSSSSCVSCSSFRSAEPCPEKVELEEFEKRLQKRAIKTLEEPICLVEEPKMVCEEHIEWVNASDVSVVSEALEVVGVEEEVLFEKECLTLTVSDVPQDTVEPVMVAEEPRITELSEDRPPAEGELVVVEVKADEPIKKDEGEEKSLVESAAEPAEVPTLETDVPVEVEKEAEQTAAQTVENVAEPTAEETAAAAPEAGEAEAATAEAVPETEAPAEAPNPE